MVCEEEHGRGEEEEEGEEGEQAISANYLPTPKSNARRNPWGNFSYADLITQVIHRIYLLLMLRRLVWDIFLGGISVSIMKHRSFWLVLASATVHVLFPCC